uniref:Vp39 n=1 Tax=Malacosoma sp. alphabaculovirus TaxID=1881632 RepID=A0A1B1V5J2_9ABAC|nr:vp39 [Malacosoma sp. alphabaculovirus]
MSIVPLGVVPLGVATTRQLRNYCIYGAVQPFSSCRPYESPCSPDAKFRDDGWYLCERHASIFFKMEKMVLPIPDSEGNTYNRMVGKSLVSHLAPDNNIDRVLIPTVDNYETVLSVQGMSLAEQLVTHMIYENERQQRVICDLLRAQETFSTDGYSVLEVVYSHATNILSITDPNRFCSYVNSVETRTYSQLSNEENRNDDIFNKMPKFIQNLISKSVAPETIQMENRGVTSTIMIRNCATCTLTRSGLVASALLYNQAVPKYRMRNDNIFKIENVVLFKGNANALNKSLATRYEEYPIIVPLILGTEIRTNKTTASIPTPMLSPGSGTSSSMGTPSTTATSLTPGSSRTPASVLEAGVQAQTPRAEAAIAT